MTLFMGEMWLYAPQGLLCSCQQFPHCWWSCRFGGTWGDVLGVLGLSHLSGDERAAEEASLGCCLLCAAASIHPGTRCALFGGKKGKSMVSPACKVCVCVCVAVGTAQLVFHHALLLILLPGSGGAPPLARQAGGGPAPKPFPAAAPTHASPCGPCSPACCWASLSLHGMPMLSLLGTPATWPVYGLSLPLPLQAPAS